MTDETVTAEPVRKRKLIEDALPLEAVNRESAREKSIRHGLPSALHLWSGTDGWHVAGGAGTEQGTVAWAARQRGYGIESVRCWERQADIDDGYAPGVSTAESQSKSVSTRSENSKRANDILKRAGRFFGAELDRQHKK